MVNARWTWIVAVALASTVLATSGVATHMSSYIYYPTEHDDQGRVAEPDFQSTSVLGPLLTNCVGDLTPTDPGCLSDATLPQTPGNAVHIAPGCTDDTGRQASGLCGLYTVGAGDGNTGQVVPQNVVGVQGQTGTKAPGRITPTKATKVRLLDAQTQFQVVAPAGGSKSFDINRKLDDTGGRSALRSLDTNFGSQIIAPGGTGLWAWYGEWTDKNGNGVIDHLEGDPPALVSPQNEFVWVGKCIQFNGSPAPAGQTYCRNETGPNGALVRMPVWIYPGNHHAYCGFAATPQGLECGVAPADFPGRQVWNTFLVGFATPEEADETDSEFTGDTLFGEQNLVSIDVEMADRTGEAVISGRHWVYGNGFASFYYDQSLLTSTVMVTGVTFGSPDSSRATTYDLGQLTSRDVDSYRTFSPAAEDLLLRTVKPAARGNWVFVRDAWITGTDQLGEQFPGTRLTYDECDPNLGLCLGTNSARTFGGLDDAIGGPGWAKEPNHAGDVFPGAVRGVCTVADPEAGSAAFRTHQGMCNNYAGHAGAWHAFMDVRNLPARYDAVAWRTPLGSCLTCVTAGPSGNPDPGPGYLRPAGDYSRVLVPGSHVFTGFVGAWRDRSQAHEEQTLDLVATLNNLALTPTTLKYTVGPDGWIGDVVNTTGTERLDGFQPVSCSVYGSFGVKEWAHCHPFLDGNREDAQSLDEDAETGGEYYTSRGAESGNKADPEQQWRVSLRPEGGCWTVPTFVWRQYDTWQMGDLGAIEDLTGKCVPIVMTLTRGELPPGVEGFNLLTKDVLILPVGNLGMPVTSTVSGVLSAVDPGRGLNLREAITDVDRYGPFGG